MYVAKLNDRGKASYMYMFDEQMYEIDDLFSKSYYMKKSSDFELIKEYCDYWNECHREDIRRNKTIYYCNVIMKGFLQAPALIVLYTSIVVGIMLLFGSEIFYEHLLEQGVAAFGKGLKNIVLVTYLVSAAVGLLASLSTYNNIFYKLIRSMSSILAFIIISPVFFQKAFFANSNVVLTLLLIAIVGCVFVRIIIDRLLTSIIRKNTEKLIRAEHAVNINKDGEAAEPADGGTEMNKEKLVVELHPVIQRVRNKEVLKQYKQYK